MRWGWSRIQPHPILEIEIMCYYTNICAIWSDWWFNNGPLVLMVIIFGIPILLWLIGQSRSSSQVEPQCGPSRGPILTARPGRSQQSYGRIQHTSYTSKRWRWRGLERSIEETKKVKREKVKR